MAKTDPAIVHLRENYLPLIKTPQTLLLVLTGLAGYVSARCPVLNPLTILAAAGSLLLAVSGSTILNMWYDRDIDALMPRTCDRPLASRKLPSREGLVLGSGLALLGVGWAVILDPLYGGVVFAGLFLDVFIYTIWLKRRTAWSIVWGGLSGGMPVLAGRALATNTIDWIGVALTLAVVFWIPTHILTFSLRYAEDYRAADIPTFPSTYGSRVTRMVISASSILAALAMGLSAYGVGLTWGYLRLIGVLSAGLLLLALNCLATPTERGTFSLYKYASIYMLASMLLLALAGIQAP